MPGWRACSMRAWFSITTSQSCLRRLRGWMYATDHATAPRESVGSKLEALMAHTHGVETDLRMTEGPASVAVLAVAEAEHADLIILSMHHATTDDHTSLTETIVKRVTARCSCCTRQVGSRERAVRTRSDGGPQIALVPTDLTPESRAAVRFAFGLARVLPSTSCWCTFSNTADRQRSAGLRCPARDDSRGPPGANPHRRPRGMNPRTASLQMASDLHAAASSWVNTRSPSGAG